MPKLSQKRRTRTSHPGVKLRSRAWSSGNTTWFARWRDPDSDQDVDTNLSTLGLTTAEARRDWAIRKFKQLAARRSEIEGGSPTRGKTAITTAITSFFESTALRLRPGTLATYREGIGAFERWLRDHRVAITEDLRAQQLAAFRDHLAKARCSVPVVGGRQGERRAGDEVRAPASVNKDLRSVKAHIHFWRRLGLVPRLDRDNITDSLSALKTPRPRPEILTAEDCRTLLESALRHDAARFKATRDEHKGLKSPGATPRYERLAPFVAFVLLTGCRLSEALHLRWNSINLTARDEHEREVGEIVLATTETKTHHERAVDLAVSPGLRSILEMLKHNAMPGAAFVFGASAPASEGRIEAGRKRLIKNFGAPDFSWQKLRQTCGSFLTNAPGIFGAASAYRSARQLGHSVAIAERHYLGLIRGIPREARTLDQAMAISDHLVQILQQLAPAPTPDGSGPKSSRGSAPAPRSESRSRR